MTRHTREAAWMCWITAAGITASASAQSSSTRPAAASQTPPVAGQPALEGGSLLGTVSGSNVYVRSGPDQNYYPVAKLNSGDRVTIVGERFGWIEILPPEGTFSVIDKNYVDRVDDKTGVLNGMTWVFAGSKLDKRHYAKQVKLDKGARLELLGETEDGKCYMMAPPRGAHMWISADFVARGGGAAAAAGPHPPSVEVVKPGELGLGPAASPSKPRTTPAKSTLATGKQKEPTTLPSVPGIDQSVKDQGLIAAIEAEITAESAKPVGDRVLEPMIKKLGPLAQQDGDEVTKLYAQTRIRQLRDHQELVATVQEMRDLREKTITDAEAMRRAREKIRVEAAIPVDDVVVRGELRVSGIYNGSASRPKRWRIVEPGSTPARTLAYIEVPPGSPIDPVQYYGKYVGIRASARQVLPGTIPPTPIFTVEEIKVLDASSQSKSGGSGATLTASPSPAWIAPPSSQPAAIPRIDDAPTPPSEPPAVP